MKNQKIDTKIGVIIIIIAAITAGTFVWRFSKMQKNSNPGNIISNTKNNAVPKSQKGEPYIQNGHKHIDGTIRDDECLTSDFKYVTFGLKRIIYTVKPKDNLWDILSYDLDQQDLVRELGAVDLSKVLDDIKDEMKMMSVDDLKKIGITSGDASELTIGDKINLSPLIMDVGKIYGKTGVDVLKFKTSSQFKKNSKYVCWEKILVTGANPETFIAFDNQQGMDDKNVYFTENVVPGADPDSLVFINRWYSKDDNHVYSSGQVFDSVDVSSFSFLGNGYSRDRESLYYGTRKVEGIKPDEISLIGNYMRWKNNIYYDNRTISGANVDKFVAIDNTYSKDDEHVFFGNDMITGANPETFKVFNINYAKDKNVAYCMGKRLEGSDAATFDVPDPISRSYYAEDEKNIYKTCVVTSKNSIKDGHVD